MAAVAWRKGRIVRKSTSIELTRRRGHAPGTMVSPVGAKAGQSRGFFEYCPVESWRPAVNLYESKDSYFVCVDLAGMDRDAIDVSLKNNVLVISGTRDHPRPGCAICAPTSELSIHLMEIDQGPFCRSVEIPSEVDLESIRANYSNTGYLWIELPKQGK